MRMLLSHFWYIPSLVGSIICLAKPQHSPQPSWLLHVVLPKAQEQAKEAVLL